MGGKRKDAATIESWFEHNVDIPTRTIFMGSISRDNNGETGVDNVMAEYFIKAMHILENQSKTLPIHITMNNIGGDWYHGMAIYDRIKRSPCHCTIETYGYAMSMGSIILQAADTRIMMPHCMFMLHYGTDGTETTHSKNFAKIADESKRLNHIMENIYLDSMIEKEEKEGDGYLAEVIAEIVNRQKMLEYPTPGKVSYSFSKNPKIKREELRQVLKELLNFDTYLDARETVLLGFADEVFDS